MGYYIHTTVHKGKIDWILKNCPGSTRTGSASLNLTKHPPGQVPVVVIDNGPFEAAGIAFDRAELESFTNPEDMRPREVLLVPKEEVLKQCPQVEHALAW